MYKVSPIFFVFTIALVIYISDLLFELIPSMIIKQLLHVGLFTLIAVLLYNGAMSHQKLLEMKSQEKK
jgi:hypothetical protein